MTAPHTFVEHPWGDAPHCSRCGRPENDPLHAPTALESLAVFTGHYAEWMDKYGDNIECTLHSRHTFGQLRAARAALALHAPTADDPAPTPADVLADEWFRDCIGQAIADYMTANAEGGAFTIDPFNSREIDGIADAVLRAAMAAARRTRRRLRGPFRVSIARMDTAGGGEHLVLLDRPDRPKDAPPWAPGRVTAYASQNRAHAEAQAAMWREFLGAAD